MAEALVGRELADLEALLVARGLPKFRAKQLFAGLYRERLGGAEESTTLPKALRAQLGEELEWGLPQTAQAVTSKDRTVRYLLGLADGKTVESVFIPESNRDTLCISSQVGCPVDCKFCLTALLGLERQLTAGEIVGQTIALCRAHDLEPRRRPLNIVMMGQGEPLLNLDNVMQSVRLMADPEGLAIPLRRITVSTSGIIPKIEEFAAHEIRPKLAISLNASTQEQRLQLMPITKKYPLADLLKVCRDYPLRSWERLTFEYVLLKGVNDSDDDARRVVSMLGQMKAKVNLIALNPGSGIDFETPDPERVDSFQKIVERALPCLVRRPRGRDIYAACGQLKRSAA